ncbi:4-hydroxy-tetrahydrodipicolinate reductase [Candidatus Palauibacter sp.]|uniref:4-hydroxy-tetrahydrodipicolinate reductase n=1 Tax=Candidatus Palauibacter sp. TaxID=3101350 RepID=UPI003B02700D
MSIRICVGGATGWTGESVVAGVLGSDGFELVGAVARRAAGEAVGAARRDASGSTVRITSTVQEALEAPTDVYIDYTHPNAVYGNVMCAIEAGVAAVIGTSGLTGREYGEIDEAARARGVGVIAAGNFSITAALLKHFSGIAARHVPHWEIVDMASAAKPDAPSGTAQELAEFLGTVASNEFARPVADTLGSREARGAAIGGAQVHSLRLPSYVISVESIFGLPDERLTIRHDAGSSAEPYVGGTLLAARLAPARVGLTQGLDRLLFD